MSDSLKQRIEAACKAFFPYWDAIVEKDYDEAIDLRERMAKALSAGDPAIDLGITEAQADALARQAADVALDVLEYDYEIVSGIIGEEWRASALHSVGNKIRPVLMALAKPAPAPKPTPQQLAETIVGGSRECSKCKAKVPVGAYCKSFDCPLNPAEPLKSTDRWAQMPFVNVTPPQGGVGATQKL